MKVAILGAGKEGRSSENYFRRHGADVQVFEHVAPAELPTLDLSTFDLILRSPSLPPQNLDLSSQTKYFFEHCPAPIIGVTGTKGKGTTCSLIASLLRATGARPHLIGNIGVPALDVLDEIKSQDVVVYELSSFQLWDLHKSPHIAVILRLEPDHLDVHADYAEYLSAKSHIAAYQDQHDFCIYFRDNPDSVRLAQSSAGTQIPYPASHPQLATALHSLSLVGPHNAENAAAALQAVAAYYDLSLDEFLQKYPEQIAHGLSDFHGLPHRLEFIRELHHVKYYDDNFATNLSSTRAALNSFPRQPIILIAGGRDKTNNADLPELADLFIKTKNLHQVILIGESGHTLATSHPSDKFSVAETLTEAVTLAQQTAEKAAQNSQNPPVVVMSPAAASFDMFESYYDRGEQYQALVKGLA